MTNLEKQLAEDHLDLVPLMVSALTRSCPNLPCDESEELTQVGYLALCRAAMNYDHNRPFEPYAKTAIRHAIFRCEPHGHSGRIYQQSIGTLPAYLIFPVSIFGQRYGGRESSFGAVLYWQGSLWALWFLCEHRHRNYMPDNGCTHIPYRPWIYFHIHKMHPAK